MKSSSTVIKAIAVFILAVMYSSAFAEYKAVTKFPNCEQIGGSRGCVGVTDPEKLKETLYLGVDETDIKACDAIAENINKMEKFNVDWHCDFPISINNFFISKPQWVEVAGKERCNAVKIIDSVARVNEGYCEKDKRPVFAIPYDLDGEDGYEKIYTMSLISKEWRCGKGIYDYRSSFWTAEADGTSLEAKHGKYTDLHMFNENFVIFFNQIYMVHYYDEFQSSGAKKEFTVSRLQHKPQGGDSIKRFIGVCSIKSISPSIEEK